MSLLVSGSERFHRSVASILSLIPLPAGMVATSKPAISVEIQTASGCQTDFKLMLDGVLIETGTITGSAMVNHTVTEDLAEGTHDASLEVVATDCGISDMTRWTFEVGPGRKIGLVIDDTGSMFDDIAAVKSALARFITSETSDPNGPAIDWSLVTFKDSVSVRGTTSDPAVIQGLVAGLFASGGGDCPEQSLGALSAAASLLSGGMESKDIVFATDASPQPGIDPTGQLVSEGIRVHTLLTGDCVAESAALSALLAPSATIPSAREVFSQLSADTGGLFLFLPGATEEELGEALDEIFETAGGGGDTTPPQLSVELSPAVLWPPNHELEQIAPIVTVADEDDPNPSVELLSVVSSEPENEQGSGNTTDDIVVTEEGPRFRSS